MVACDKTAAKEVAKTHKHNRVSPSSTSENITSVVVRGIFGGAVAAAQEMDNIKVREYVAGRPNAFHNYFRAECMQDKGYLVAVPTDEELAQLNSAKTSTAKKAILDRIFARKFN